MAEHLVILGASARAAAFSALRAGFLPWTADLFADADLAARCPARRVTDYPAELGQAARDAPPGPWMYTGALENHPKLVDCIAAERPLWGNRGAALRQVRDPRQVSETLLADGLPCPKLTDNPRTLMPGVWLRKPGRSAGGAHIDRIEVQRLGEGPEAESPTAARREVYYQQFVEGVPHSGVFVAAAGRAILLGVTRQLTGESWTGASGFQYAGSIGPQKLTAAEQTAWRRIGDCLARRFDLVGLFGVDAVCNSRGVFPVEINPRYTASVEVLERAWGIHALILHAAACRTGQWPTTPESRSRLPDGTFCPPGLGARRAFQTAEGPARQAGPTIPVCGKAILYARRDGPGGEPFWRFVDQCNDGGLWPTAADLPARGEIFRAGRPVMTLFATGADATEVEHRLRRCAAQVFTLLEP